ncbi:MAG: primosomal protein N' family DNA-binding protein, partial [Methylobacter sp.]
MAKLHNGNELIFRVAVPVPLYRLFDYLPPDNVELPSVKPGVRLEVPFGKTKKTAFLVEISQQSDVDTGKLKRATRIIDDKPLLSAKDMALLQWVSRYYHHPLGEVISAAFPVALRQGKPAVLQTEKRYGLTALGKSTPSDQLTRSPKQKTVLEKFQCAAMPLSETELSIWNSNWRTAVKQLLSKQLLQLETTDSPVKSPELLIRTNDLQCNPQQQAAITRVTEHLGQFGVFLLEGVTGSGKTEVYMQIIRAVLERGQQV